MAILTVGCNLLLGCSPAADSPDSYSPPIEPSSALYLPPTPEDAGSPLCSDPYPHLVTDLEIRQTPDLPEPPPRSPFRDPVFGTCIVRVTDREADVTPDDSSPGLKNEYARVQSFNSDGSLFLVYGIDGSWYLYSTDTLQPLRQLPLYDEPRWDGDDPHVIYHIDETLLLAYNVSTGEQHIVRQFLNDLPGQAPVVVWTRYEGSPSADTRFWGFMAEDEEWIPTVFLVYDLETDQVAIRDMRGVPGTEEDVDHVTMSPLGTYFLASFDRACEDGQLGSDTHPCGLMVYRRDLTEGRGLLRVIGHYDIALDAQGREVVVYQDIDTDQIALLDLATGQVTPLWAIDFSHSPIGFHFSGRAFERPGWALVSTYSGGHPTDHTWMDDTVFAIELRAGGSVVRLAHTHSLVDEDQEHDYWAEPHASVNQDFTQVLFTSNWGRSGTGEVEMYLIELPASWSN